jgi:ketosteroid isomerase-like protein
MTDRASIEKIVRDAYGARRRNDAEATLAFFAPTAEFRLVGPEPLAPLTTAVRDHGSLRPMFTQLFATWDWSNYAMVDLLVDGDRAALRCAGPMRFVPTNTVIDTQTFDLITIQEGKIVHLLEFFDTLTVAGLSGVPVQR